MPEDSNRTGTDTGRLSAEDAGRAFESLLTSDEDTGEEEGDSGRGSRHENEGEERLRRALRREDLEDRADESAEEESEEQSEEDTEEETDEEESQSDDVQPRKRARHDEEFTLHLEGKDVPVRLSELKNGYLRQSDYTRKTQGLANERKSFEQEQQQARAERAEYAELLPRLRKAVELEVGNEPNWAEIQAKNPQSFPLEWARWQQKSKQLEQLKAEEQRILQRHQADEQARQNAYGAQQRGKLLETEPSFRDPKTAGARAAAIIKSMRAVGFGDDELVVTDYRMIRLLNKAATLDELMTKQPNLRKQMKNAPVVRPGGGSRQSNPTRDASQRLSQSGKVSDAAKLLESFLS